MDAWKTLLIGQSVGNLNKVLNLLLNQPLNMSSYYRTINGHRYDVSLLEMAEGMMEGRGDGRLSLADVEQLWESAFDGRGMTAVEMATLAYIREHENPTRPAKEWLDEQGFGRHAENNFLSWAGQVTSKHDLEELRLMRFYLEEIANQSRLPGSVSFPVAFERAVEAILDPAHQNESPYQVISKTEFEDGGTPQSPAEIKDKLKEMINYGTLWLVPMDTPPNPNASQDYYPPENGESVQDNWIFNLTLFEVSDHLYWVVVPRNGDPLKVYGFN